MRTAVVGAGLSGLALAHALRARGEAVALFDKGRAPGGRVSTRRVEDLAFDHGAQYFTCRDPRFERLLADWLAAGVAARWEGRVRSLTRGAVATPREATERYVGAPGMSAITRHLAHDLEVLCGRRVTALERAPQGWRLVADGEELGSFERVVVSVPAPQALPLLAAAPALARRVAAVEMQPCQAALVAFEAPLPLPFEGAFVQDSLLAWVARSLGKPGRPVADCWVLHAGPDWSSAHLEDPPEAVVAALLAAFAEAGGGALPTPRYAAAHRWRYALTQRPLGRPFLYDAALGLGVCGDWCDGGRIEGAVLSGMELATAIGENVQQLS